MRIITICVFLICAATTTSGQKVFFTAPQTFNAEQLSVFYASITLRGDYLLYNAPDYKLYAYSTNNNQARWQYMLNRASNTAPFFISDSAIWANSKEGVVQLGLRDGEVKKKGFPFHSVATQPYRIGGIIYATGLRDGGCLYAYDLQKDSLLWYRFLAHGYSVEPSYLKDRIIANVEGRNWLDISYTGKLSNPSYDTLQVDWPSELPGVREYVARTHDGVEVKGKLAEEIGIYDDDQPDVILVKQHTFLLNNGMLYVIGNKGVLLQTVRLDTLLGDIEVSNSNQAEKLIKCDDESAWILVANHLAHYNIRTKSLVKKVDLTAWRPHQIVLQGFRIWLVSKKDGRLYGIEI